MNRFENKDVDCGDIEKYHQLFMVGKEVIIDNQLSDYYNEIGIIISIETDGCNNGCIVKIDKDRKYFDFDVSIIRILWVIGTVVSAGIGIVVYIVMLLVFPEEPGELGDKGTSV